LIVNLPVAAAVAVLETPVVGPVVPAAVNVAPAIGVPSALIVTTPTSLVIVQAGSTMMRAEGTKLTFSIITTSLFSFLS
jgi:hypothetical protein